MAKMRKETSSRKPPEPADSHAVIEEWMKGLMPALGPIARHIDGMIRDTLSDLQYAVKWKKAYYGLPDHGWVIEMVSYDVSVNVVFLGGAAFDPEPPLGEGDGRYIKVKSIEEADTPEMRDWIEQAGTVPGWK